MNEFDIIIIFGTYPELSTLLLSVGHNKINMITINGKHPVKILKDQINENNDKEFWRKKILDQMEDSR